MKNIQGGIRQQAGQTELVADGKQAEGQKARAEIRRAEQVCLRHGPVTQGRVAEINHKRMRALQAGQVPDEFTGIGADARQFLENPTRINANLHPATFR